MKSLYVTDSLPFWSQREILLREQFTARLLQAMQDNLLGINQAWRFERIDGPLITPRQYVNAAYDEDDIWLLQAKVAGEDATMRAETTASSYLYAEQLLKAGEAKMPLCIWQAGKSFRRETNDGARASTLRFNEFYQLEFQCIFAESTKADYATPTYEVIKNEIANLCGTDTRLVESDRLPSYSTKTMDVEALWKTEKGDIWKEMCSISLRTDFPGGHRVLEVAAGLDRLVRVATS